MSLKHKGMDGGMPRRLYVNGNGCKNIFGFFLEQGKDPVENLRYICASKAKNNNVDGQGSSGIPSMQNR